jgi:hypothetical protein
LFKASCSFAQPFAFSSALFAFSSSFFFAVVMSVAMVANESFSTKNEVPEKIRSSPL